MKTDFIRSQRHNNIFYGDIFKINNKGCLIFGYGKTKACSLAAENEEKNGEVALDFACLTKKGQDICGHFELDARHKDVPDPINERIKLDYFVRMLNEDETKNYSSNGNKGITEITLNEFIKVSDFNITNDIDFNRPIPMYRNSNKLNTFKKITQNGNIKCIVVPYMESCEERGKLLKQYIK